MTAARRSKPWWRRSRAVLASIALLTLVLGPAAVNGTLAGWSGTGTSNGTFTAGKLGAVQNLKCINQGIGGLLTTKVKLEWAAPATQIPVSSVYLVTVKKNGTVVKSEETSNLSFMYDDTNLVRIASYELTVQQKTSAGTWTGEGRTVTASGISVVLGVTMICGSSN